MKQKINYLIGISAILIFLTSCHDIEKNTPPEIILGQMEYLTKPNRAITVEPEVKNTDQYTVYSWSLNGKVIGTAPTLTFSSEEEGTYYLKFKVITESGQAQTDVKVEVASLIPPKISFEGGKDEFILETGEVYTFQPNIQNKEGLKMKWMIDDKVVSTDENYQYEAKEEGLYFIEVSAENEDGEDNAIIKLLIVKGYPPQISFPYKEQSASLGRTIRLMPYIQTTKGVTFQWFVNGKEDKSQTGQYYIYTPTSLGKTEVKVIASKMKSGQVTSSGESTDTGNRIVSEQTITINTVQPERTLRPITGSSKRVQNKVYEFLPAPGQFVNEGYKAYTMEEANAYAEKRLSQNGYVSLGAFGGYIIVGFDHSIRNSGDYDFGIKGNSFKGSSEPGIVWVMQDENGNGLPDDNWYELKGSETGKPSTIQDYSVTYYRNSIPKQNILWIDNKGHKGEVDWLGFHQQDSYYPNWVKEDSYTLSGTCLASQTFDQSGNGTYWVNPEFEWGYADNFSPIDRLTNDINYNAAPNANHFKISNAITFDGKPIHLEYIDFIKVQTGLNTKAGWLGENSTEVFEFFDMHIKK